MGVSKQKSYVHARRNAAVAARRAGSGLSACTSSPVTRLISGQWYSAAEYSVRGTRAGISRFIAAQPSAYDIRPPPLCFHQYSASPTRRKLRTDVNMA